MNKPAYEFLRYELTKAIINHSETNQIEKMEIKLSSFGFSDDTNIYLISISVIFNYFNNEESSMSFMSAFQINELDWITNENQKSINQIFVATCFPFIRSKILEMTSDTRQGFFIPTFDLRNVDMEKGILFETSRTRNK